MVRAKHRPWAHPILAVILGKSWKNFKFYLVVLKLSLILQVFHKCVFLVKKRNFTPISAPSSETAPWEFPDRDKRTQTDRVVLLFFVFNFQDVVLYVVCIWFFT